MKQFGLVLIGAVLIGLLYWFLWRDNVHLCEADPSVCPCMRLLPEDRLLGIKFVVENGQLKELEFGGSKAQGEAPSAEQAERFVQCLERVRSDATIKNFSRLNAAPIGQIANLWKRENGTQISLRPASPEEKTTINNLQIGPTRGVRWKILELWCGGSMSSCVSCGEISAGDETVAVEVRLKKNAPLVREFWSDEWPKAQTKRKAWELVDNEGNRYLYACRPAG